VTVARLAIALLLASQAPSSLERTRGIDVQAYCRKVHGDSANVVHRRNEAGSWVCVLRAREYPVDMKDACAVQYGAGYTAIVANQRDSFSWSCVRRRR
jgi:hypothetical protein